MAAGFTVVRLREIPLDSLVIHDPRYFAIFVNAQAPDAEGVNAGIERVSTATVDMNPASSEAESNNAASTALDHMTLSCEVPSGHHSPPASPRV